MPTPSRVIAPALALERATHVVDHGPDIALTAGRIPVGLLTMGGRHSAIVIDSFATWRSRDRRLELGAAQGSSTSMRDWTPCKNADALDFFRPELVEQIRRIGEEPRMHCKQWEYAQLLEVRRRLAPEAKRLVGLGCGCEKSIPLVGAGADEVTVTDLYDRAEAWDVAKDDPRRVFPEMDNLRVHSMDMTAIDLPAESADFVWSLCAIEHVGGLQDITRALRQAGELLTDDGLLFVSTELNLTRKPYRTPTTLYPTRDQLVTIVRGSGLHVVSPIELSLSRHPMNTPVAASVNDDFGAVPHVVYHHQHHPAGGLLGGIFATVVSFVLSRRDAGHDVLDVDPGLDGALEDLAAQGRRLNRRLSLPWAWW